MDSFELNKVLMALLGSVFIVLGLNFISEGIYHPHSPETQGYAIAAAEGGGESGGAETSGPAYDPVEPLLASADLAAGENVFKKCASCHTWEQGGQNKVGPNLWAIVERPIASHEGFGYSAALTEFGQGKTWTYEELNGFLWKPKTHVKGTAMGFAGLAKVEERANLIAWMRTHSDNPVPLPGN